jgi:hypothetical protein
MVRDIYTVAPYMCIMHQLVPRDLLLNFGGGYKLYPPPNELARGGHDDHVSKASAARECPCRRIFHFAQEAGSA